MYFFPNKFNFQTHYADDTSVGFRWLGLDWLMKIEILWHQQIYVKSDSNSATVNEWRCDNKWTLKVLGAKLMQRFKAPTEFRAILFQMQGKDAHGTNRIDSVIRLVQLKVPLPQSIQTRTQNIDWAPVNNTKGTRHVNKLPNLWVQWNSSTT